jgi:hypothetical protein
MEEDLWLGVTRADLTPELRERVDVLLRYYGEREIEDAPVIERPPTPAARQYARETVNRILHEVFQDQAPEEQPTAFWVARVREELKGAPSIYEWWQVWDAGENWGGLSPVESEGDRRSRFLAWAESLIPPSG